jgi:hypothetical protein
MDVRYLKCSQMQFALPFRTRATVSYARVCMSKKGRISALVALKSVTPPSRPEVDGHTCPRHLTVYPLTTAALFEAEQMDCWSVVSVCGLETMASIPSLTKNAMSDEVEGTFENPLKLTENWPSSRMAHSHCELPMPRDIA